MRCVHACPSRFACSDLPLPPSPPPSRCAPDPVRPDSPASGGAVRVRLRSTRHTAGRTERRAKHRQATVVHTSVCGFIGRTSHRRCVVHGVLCSCRQWIHLRLRCCVLVWPLCDRRVPLPSVACRRGFPSGPRGTPGKERRTPPREEHQQRREQGQPSRARGSEPSQRRQDCVHTEGFMT